MDSADNANEGEDPRDPTDEGQTGGEEGLGGKRRKTWKDVNFVNLDNLIEKSFWKNILLEVISELNPWDIDIVELATRYSKRVERMKELNFKIPANVIIVSSVLLRMKSDLLTFSGPDLEYDLEEWVLEGAFLEEFTPLSNFEESSHEDEEKNKTGRLTNIDIDPRIPIQVKPRRVPKRRITALELISAIQEVLEDKERYRLKKEKKNNGDEEDIVITPKFDIKRLIHETYLRVMGILMKKNVAKFSELVDDSSREDIVSVLISLLHLSHNKKLKLMQKKLFGEIFIQPFSLKENCKGR
jgi:segregation and condensation protein A